jgi:hypothetical protein
MSVPRLQPDAALPPAFDDRSALDVGLDTAAAGVRGSLMAYEAEFGGEMSMTLQIILRTIDTFLEDVEEVASKEIADQYAAALIKGIEER